ncbi:DNA polymerase Y family protein [Dokdonella sp.]|uniref:Y-family DNA polymerase n=1 Tax=Dokdonella sp. TaxID=2291710 RepID=UPI0035275BE1
MLWACLYFPELPLDAVRPQDCARELPAVLVDGPVRNPRVVMANAAARLSGIGAGQSLAAARALQADLAAWRREPDAEQQMLGILADSAYRFSGEVSLLPPRALLLEVGASLGLFGGWAALERRLRGDLDGWGVKYRLVAAPVASGARVLAGSQDGVALLTHAQLLSALSNIPVENCGLELKTSSSLSSMGLNRLGQLFALPRPELTRRIGPAALLHLDRMRGLASEALPGYQPPTRYARRLEFEHRIDSVQALLFPLQRMLRELARFLIVRDAGVQDFELILEHEHQATTQIRIGLLEAQRDAGKLLELTQARLERISLVAPVQALQVNADDLPLLRPLHEDLFDTNPDETMEWPTLVERLRARLGDEAIRCLLEVADHRPDRAWRLRLPDTRGSGRKPASTAPTEAGRLHGMASRPLWLLRKAIPLRPSPLRIIAGPERIESGWWDGDDQRHDYYIVQTRDGQRAWAYVASGEIDNWMLQGWFA